MNPRASATFCHWPWDRSTPPGQDGPSWVSRPVSSRRTTSSAPARPTAASRGVAVVEVRQVADPDRLLGGELEAEEVLEGAREAGPPGIGLDLRQGHVVDQ